MYGSSLVALSDAHSCLINLSGCSSVIPAAPTNMPVWPLPTWRLHCQCVMTIQGKKLGVYGGG
jgi:hypothetical protein